MRIPNMFGKLAALALCWGVASWAAAPVLAAKAPDDPANRLINLEWWLGCGEDAPRRPDSPIAWRNVSLDLTDDRDRRHLRIRLVDGPSPVVWQGDPGPEVVAEIEELFARLPHPPAVDWPGGMDRKTFRNRKREDRKKVCSWELRASYGDPRGWGASRRLEFQGVDRNEAHAPRHAFDEPMTVRLAALAKRLQDTRPKRLAGLSYRFQGADGAVTRYLLDVDKDGRTRVSRRKPGADDRAEVDPAAAGRVASLTRRHKADAWHDFEPPNRRENSPGAFEFVLSYDTGQSVRARGLRDGADGASRPAGFAAFERELLSALDEALDGPSGARPAPPRRGLRTLSFSEGNGYAGYGVSYRLAPRREAGRDVFRLVVRSGSRGRDGEGGSVKECVLTDADMAGLEAILERRRVAKWDGFLGTNRDVMDGDSFNFSLEYTDGRTTRASGYENYPKGYREAMGEILGHLNGIMKRCAAGRPARE